MWHQWLLSVYFENALSPVRCKIRERIAGKRRAEGGRTRKLERAVVRDSKGWWIDRRRSVTRYSCQQAAGIASPFPTFRFLHYPIPVRHPRWPVRYGCRVTQEYSPRKCSIDVFSVTKASRWHPPCPVLPLPPPPPIPVSRFPHIALLLSRAFSILFRDLGILQLLHCRWHW